MPGAFGRLGKTYGKRGPGSVGVAEALILLSASTLEENSAEGTAIGSLSVSNGSGTYTFTCTDSASNKVKVAGANGVNLQAGSSATDYETATSHSITIHADNGAGSVLDRTFTITVTDVAEAGGDSLLLFNSQGITFLHLGYI